LNIHFLYFSASRAVKNGNTEKVVSLLDEKYDIEAENPEKQTAVHLACINGHESILEELINRSADVNKRDVYGDTPLHVCNFFSLETFKKIN
jgi:uncharacterized protein